MAYQKQRCCRAAPFINCMVFLFYLFLFRFFFFSFLLMYYNASCVDGVIFLSTINTTHIRVNIVIGMKVERIYTERNEKTQSKNYIYICIIFNMRAEYLVFTPTNVCSFVHFCGKPWSGWIEEEEKNGKEVNYEERHQMANHNEWNAVCYRKKVI